MAPAPKKKTKSAATTSELTKAAFLKKYKNQAANVKKSGKETAPSGFVEDAKIIEMMKMRVGVRKQVKARISSVKMQTIKGLKDAKQKPLPEVDKVNFNFTYLEGPIKGMNGSVQVWLQETTRQNGDEVTIADCFKEVVFNFQRLGYDTSDLTLESLFDACAEATEDKPKVLVSLNPYKSKSGKSKGQLKLGINFVKALEDEEEEEETEEEETEDEEEEESEEEEDEDSDEEEEEGEEDGESSDEDEEEEESEEEDEDEESEEEGPDQDDPKTWIGYVVKAKMKGEKKAAQYEVIAWASKTKKLTLKSVKDGKLLKNIDPSVVIDFVEAD